jgi:hypothetical protein
MALEQISTEMDVDIDQKNPGKPKKKLSSMKKVEVMDTELRRNVPVSQVKKENDEFVKAMVYAKRKQMEEINKNKSETLKPKLFAKPTMNVKSETTDRTYNVVKQKKITPMLKKSMMKRGM